MFDECCMRATNTFATRELLFVSVAPSRSRVRFWNGAEDCPSGGGRVTMPKRRTTALLIFVQAVQSLAIAATVVLAAHVIIWLAGHSLIVTNALGDSTASFEEQAD
jgi:hypothetical protein